jgi:hypothetical protein
MGEHTIPEAWEEHHHERIVHTHERYGQGARDRRPVC